jgi:hypothetical protein
MKILYVVFWTFILNALCSYGYYQLSWFLLLLPFILFFIMVFLLGMFLNNRTASDPSSNSGSGSNQWQQWQQSQASQMNMMQQKSNNSGNVQPPGSEQSHWFLQGNQNNAGGAGGGSKQYSSYGDYDHALDQRTKQVYNESHEKNQTNQHYK